MSEEPIVTSLSPGTAAYVQPPGGWFLNNAGWATGPDGMLLIDTCATETRTRRLLAAADAAHGRSGKPSTVALTHAHGDHANGAGLVARTGGTVIATHAAAQDVAAGPHTYPAVFSCSTWGDITPPDAIDSITSAVRLDLGGEQIAEIIPVPGVAHTSGDLVVWLPRDGVLFTGDLVFDGVTPLALQGSPSGWLRVLDWITGFDAAHLVPGHGPVSAPESGVIGRVSDYLRWLLDTAAAQTTLDFTVPAEHARERWPAWLDSERHAANLAVAHAEVHGYTCDLPAALAAMVTAAGGPITLDI